MANKHAVRLRQSYLRIAKRAAMMAGRYAHAKQFNRHRRELRMLRTRLGRIIRDTRRRIIALLVGFGISPIRDLVVGRTIDVTEWVPAVSAVPSYGNPRCCCIDQYAHWVLHLRER